MSTTLAMIPARKGSQRLKYKNLALIDGQPMISYVIKAAKEANVFDDVYVNSDAAVFESVAKEYGVDFYHRPAEYGSSETKSDEVVYDFIESHDCDTLAWVNPIAPLQPAEEIQEVVEYFEKESLESLITVKEEQVHCVHDDEPVNFTYEGKFEKTQSLTPVYPFVYSIMMWDVNSFLEEYQTKGYGLFCGKTDYYPVSQESTFIVKYKSDLKLIDAIKRGQHKQGSKLNYHNLAEDIK